MLRTCFTRDHVPYLLRSLTPSTVSIRIDDPANSRQPIQTTFPRVLRRSGKELFIDNTAQLPISSAHLNIEYLFDINYAFQAAWELSVRTSRILSAKRRIFVVVVV